MATRSEEPIGGSNRRGYGSVLPAGRVLGDLRQHNRALVLEIIRTQGPISRAELAGVGRLSAPTVLEIIDELMGEGLVKEDGMGPSTGGRRPTLLTLVEHARYSVGLSVGSRTLTAVATDLYGRVALRLETASAMSQGPQALVARVNTTLAEVLDSIPQNLGQPLGIGLALPTPVTNSMPGIRDPSTYPGWGEIRLGELIAEEHGLPVLVDNVANAAAVGEHLFGAGQGTRSMVYVMAHRGIGGATIINGEIYRGAEGAAGEIGHLRIELDGPRCGCGNYGCLEAFVGRVAIRRRAQRLLKLSARATMGGREVEEIRAQDVIEAGLEGDEIAREVLREAGRYLGIGISNVVHLLNPELVVVGGATMQAGSWILESAKELVNRQVLPSMAGQARVVAGELSEDAGAIGAAALVLRELFAVSVPQERSEAQ